MKKNKKKKFALETTIPSNNGDCNMLMNDQKPRRVAVNSIYIYIFKEFKVLAINTSPFSHFSLSFSFLAQGLHNPPLLFVSEYTVEANSKNSARCSPMSTPIPNFSPLRFPGMQVRVASDPSGEPKRV